MEPRRRNRAVGLVLIVAGLAVQAPIAWAQPLEVADPAEITREVASQVDRLVAELAARDPELAKEIERQAELCERDLADGQLDHEGFTRDIEGLREVQGTMERAMQGELETRIGELVASGNTELAHEMQRAFELWQSGGELAPGAPEGLEAFRPTPELMGQMHEAFGGVMREMIGQTEMREFVGVAGEGFVRDFFEHAASAPDGDARSPEEMARQRDALDEMGRGGEFDTRRAAEIFDLDPHEAEMLSRMSEQEARAFLEGIQREDEMGQDGEFHGGPELVRDFAGELFHEGPEGGAFREFADAGHEFGTDWYHEGPETIDDFYRDVMESYRDLLTEHDPDTRLELLRDLAVGLDDVAQQKADSRYSATLDAAEANLTVAERDSVKDTGATVHKEFFSDVDPNRAGAEHLHTDYTRGTESIGTHVDARVDLHDHTTDEVIKTFTHITDIGS